MAELVVTALLAPSRLTLKLLRALMWSLVFSAALVAAAVYSCIALTHVLCRPRRGCCGRPRCVFPACLSDPSLGEHDFLTLQSSGLRLHYVSAGRGNGPLMLFLHGFPENWFSWRYQLREFQSRFHVVAVDMRGYWPSDAPGDVDCYTTDLLMVDIQDVILGLGGWGRPADMPSSCALLSLVLPACRAATPTLGPALPTPQLNQFLWPPGYSKCVLVGHDWGGFLAWNFSIYYPALVERLVVASAAPMSVYQDYSLRHISQLFRSHYMFLFQLPWLPEKLLSMSDFQILKTIFTHSKTGIPRVTLHEIEAFLYSFTQAGGLVGPLNYYRNIFRNFPLEPQELSTRTLLLWGEKDIYLEPGLVGAVGSRFVPGRLEAHILPDVGHWVPQSNPEEMHQYMWAFLRDLLD
ncbi:epoxide hydrolase 3 isoform 1-T1 [Trichechus inunguis]